MDMTEGIIARFRTMAISRASVLTGHVVGSVIQTDAQPGRRRRRRPADRASGPPPSPVEWLGGGRRPGAGRLRAHLAGGRAAAWSAKTVEAASNLPMPLILLPFLGSGVRPDRLDAGRAALVRRVPAVHPDHRDPARAAAGHRDRQQRGRSPSPGASASPLVGYLWAQDGCSTATRSGSPARALAALPQRRAARAAARRPSRPRSAYDDTASSYAGLSACSARPAGAGRGHGRLEAPQEPEPLGQRDHPHPRPAARSSPVRRPRSRSAMARASSSAPQTGKLHDGMAGVGDRVGEHPQQPRGSSSTSSATRSSRPCWAWATTVDGLDLQGPRLRAERSSAPATGSAVSLQPVDGPAPQAAARPRRRLGRARSRRARRGRSVSVPTGSSARRGAVCSSQCSASSTSPRCRLASTMAPPERRRSVRPSPQPLQHRAAPPSGGAAPRRPAPSCRHSSPIRAWATAARHGVARSPRRVEHPPGGLQRPLQVVLRSPRRSWRRRWRRRPPAARRCRRAPQHASPDGPRRSAQHDRDGPRPGCPAGPAAAGAG